jgi:two-component system chemotaxis response regulator CheY
MKQILLVDDNGPLRGAASRFLVNEGFRVTEAENGDVALRLFRQSRPDLIVLDLVMPDREGLETIRELRRLDPQVPIIAMSGAGAGVGRAKDYLHSASMLGATRTLAKPFALSKLLSLVRELLNSQEEADTI